MKKNWKRSFTSYSFDRKVTDSIYYSIAHREALHSNSLISIKWKIWLFLGSWETTESIDTFTCTNLVSYTVMVGMLISYENRADSIFAALLIALSLFVIAVRPQLTLTQSCRTQFSLKWWDKSVYESKKKYLKFWQSHFLLCSPAQANPVQC